jgi:2-isopropylmalate synthase
VDALADVALRFAVDGHSVPGRGLSNDVVEASARAFLNAINRTVRVRDTGESLDRSGRPGSLSHPAPGI